MAEQPISWITLEPGVAIMTSDGAELGRVNDVVADRQQDIFSGVTFSDGVLSGDRFVPADLIDTITTEAVTLSVTEADAKNQLEPYEP